MSPPRCGPKSQTWRQEPGGPSIGGRSVSEVIDVALGRLIRSEQLRRDVEAYSRRPPTAEEIALAHLPVTLDLDDDEVDYDAHYGQR